MEKNCLYFTYTNNRLDIFIFKNYKNNALLLFEKTIERFKISDLNDSVFLEKLKMKIKRNYESAIKDNPVNEIKLILSPRMFYFKRKELIKNFEDVTLITENDITRLKNFIIKNEQIEDSYRLINIEILKKFVDNKKVLNFEEQYGQKIEAVSDLLFCDKETYNNIIDLLDVLNIKIKNVLITDYLLKDKLLSDKELIIDIEFSKINFIIQNNDQITNLTLDLGLENILEKTYSVLCEYYEKTVAEKLTRFIKKTWILKKLNIDYDIINGVNINEVLSIFQNVLFQFFEYIFTELKNRKIDINKVKIISEDISVQELSYFLENTFNFEFSPLFKRNILISEFLSEKLKYCIKKDMEVQ